MIVAVPGVLGADGLAEVAAALLPRIVRSFLREDLRAARDAGGGVNLAVGLPVIRTPVDHGTAFGIPGTGVAGAGRMIGALRQAATLAPGRGP